MSSEAYYVFENRKKDEILIDAHISDWFASKEAQEVMFQLQTRGIAAGVVSSNRQLLSDPHLNQREFFADMNEPLFGVKRYDGQSIQGNFINKSDWKTTEEVGGSSKEILMKLLGYTNDDCETLGKEGTILFQ